MSKMNHLTRQSNAETRAADRATRRDAKTLAADWLTWMCARDGIELPENYTVEFYPAGERGVAVLTEKWNDFYHGWHRGSGRRAKLEYHAPAELASIPVPAWAMPCKRVDLWHEAHQAGLSLGDCMDEGDGWDARHRPALDIRQRAAERASVRAHNARQTRTWNEIKTRGFSVAAWNKVATWFPLPIGGVARQQMAYA